MNTAELVNDDEWRKGDLLPLQLQIARRADELAHARTRTPDEGTDWECWLQAEREILGGVPERTVAAATVMMPAGAARPDWDRPAA